MNISEILGAIVSLAFALLIVAHLVHLLLFGDDYPLGITWGEVWNSIVWFCDGALAVIMTFAVLCLPVYPLLLLALLPVIIVRGLWLALVWLNKLVVGD